MRCSQVLKYEQGQFYKQHHDQQSGHWTPQGVRLYTFFLYLSDVEVHSLTCGIYSRLRPR